MSRVTYVIPLYRDKLIFKPGHLLNSKCNFFAVAANSQRRVSPRLQSNGAENLQTAVGAKKSFYGVNLTKSRFVAEDETAAPNRDSPSKCTRSQHVTVTAQVHTPGNYAAFKILFHNPLLPCMCDDIYMFTVTFKF